MISACDQAARQAISLLLLLIERCHARWRPALVCLSTRLHGIHAHRGGPSQAGPCRCRCLALPCLPRLALSPLAAMCAWSRLCAQPHPRLHASVSGNCRVRQRWRGQCLQRATYNHGTAMRSHSAAEGTAGSISAGSAAKLNACTCQFHVVCGMARAILHVASCMPRVVLHLSKFEPERLRWAVAHAPTHTVARSAIMRAREYLTHTCHDT